MSPRLRPCYLVFALTAPSASRRISESLTATALSPTATGVHAAITGRPAGSWSHHIVVALRLINDLGIFEINEAIRCTRMKNAEQSTLS